MHGWLSNERPIVHVLTDGSGSGGESRIASTTALLDAAGATRGTIYGRLSDRAIYTAMLGGDHAQFVAIAEELAADMVERNVELVAGDAVEGFNPSHDVCRYIINAAVRLASAAGGRRIECYAFPLDGAPQACPDPAREGAIWLQLDDAALARKLSAASEYRELKAEVEAVIARFGTEAFRTECLWPVDSSDPYGWDPARVPFYESYGAERVASGAYTDVVTFSGHVQPLADALWCRGGGAR